MRVSVDYVECPNGERTRCERLTLEAVAGAEMEALHELARLLTGGEPVQRVVRRLVDVDARLARWHAAAEEEARAARTNRAIAEVEAIPPG